MRKNKIVLFGGTFDPIHPGHITVANHAAEIIGAQTIIFIPAKQSPLKDFSPIATDRDRLNMIELAIAGDGNMQLSDYELNKPQPSYTLETVEYFQAQYGAEASIYWLAGADNIKELPRWYRICDLIDCCNLSIMFRAGCLPPDFSKFIDIWGSQRVEKMKKNIIETPLIDISSTQIRAALAQGTDVTEMLCPAVADYIHTHNLYKSDSTS